MNSKILSVFVLMFCILVIPLTARTNSPSDISTGFNLSKQIPISCVVKLRKGQKLIIRNQNGKRLSGTLANGTSVTAVNMADGDPSGGTAEIAVTRKGGLVVLGWVKQSELRCKFS